MHIILNVPYSEKDDAKLLGAKWNPKIKKWYVPDGVNIENFTRWRIETPYTDEPGTCVIRQIPQDKLPQYIRHLFNEFEELP